MKWATAVTPSATRGRNARDEIIVATMLLESWNPFRKSKMRAMMINAMMSVNRFSSYLFVLGPYTQLILTTMSAMMLPASSPRSAALLR